MEDAGSATAEPTAASRKKEIYTYEAPWLIYGMNWSNRRGKPFRLALGSFIEEYNNTVDVVQLNEETQAFEPVPGATFQHPYPTTKIMWAPESHPMDHLATTGDYLRLWESREDGTIKQKCMLNNVRAVSAGPVAGVPTCPRLAPPLRCKASKLALLY